MPTKPLGPCRQSSTCPELEAERGSGACKAHAKAKGQAEYVIRGSKRARGFPSNWEALRAFILRRDPVCKACSSALSTEVDHIVPRMRAGTNNPLNLQGLCEACHAIKSVIERTVTNAELVMIQVRQIAADPAKSALYRSNSAFKAVYSGGDRGGKSSTEFAFRTAPGSSSHTRVIGLGGS